MLNEMKTRLPAYEVRRIARETFPQVWDVYASNEEFFLLTEGRAAAVERSIGDTDALPPGYNPSQKLYVGCFDRANGKPVAVMDLLRGYPNEGCVWIGLLLVHTGYKRRGVGSVLTDAVCGVVKAKGCTSAQLGVVAGNDAALAFWTRCGFAELRKAKANIAGTEKDVVVMEKRLD
jgi:ribosomal protein S18 acetylase RimI-like enzyme